MAQSGKKPISGQVYALYLLFLTVPNPLLRVFNNSLLFLTRYGGRALVMTHSMEHIIDLLTIDVLKAAPVFSNDGLNRPRDWWVKCKEKYSQVRLS
ncbi:hypothetical protein AAIM60_17655 [Pseudomonas lijiangensis]|uniref:hypothetical protein n=1 Tax=Pseudomonas syringae group TaxID=136849 RepID=UPI0018E5BAB5|nr:hypothetical protein [Pseudomonas cichorii]MBI6851859.1 hypothetical protein [Pseudomonas cichorii]